MSKIMIKARIKVMIMIKAGPGLGVGPCARDHEQDLDHDLDHDHDRAHDLDHDGDSCGNHLGSIWIAIFMNSIFDCRGSYNLKLIAIFLNIVKENTTTILNKLCPPPSAPTHPPTHPRIQT